MDEILTIRRRSQPTKSTVFSCFFSRLLSPSNKIPCSLNIIIHLFAEFQVLAILIRYVFQYFEQDGQDALAQGISHIASAFSLNFTFDFSGEDNFTNIVTAFIGVYSLLVIFTIIALGVLEFLKVPFKLGMDKIWTGLGTFHASCLFLFIQNFTLAFAKVLAEQDSSSAPLFKSKMSRELAIAVITISMIVNIAMGIINSRFAYNPIKNHSLMATRSTTFAFMGFLYIFIVTLCDFLFRNTTEWRKWTASIVGLFLLIGRSYHYLREIPFYNLRIFKLFLTIMMIQLVQLILNIFWTLIDIRRMVPTSMVIYSLLPLGIFATRIGFNYLERLVQAYAIKETRTLKSENEFFIKMFAWEKVLKSSGSLFSASSQQQHEFIYQHIVKNHSINCQQNDCGCKFILLQSTLENGRLKTSNISRFDLQQLSYELIRDLYEEGIQYIAENSLIQLQYANFLVNNNGDTIANIIYLLNSAYDTSSSSRKHLMEAFNTIIQAKLEIKIASTSHTQHSNLQVKRFVDYHVQKSILRKKITEYTCLYINFWETYNQPNPLVKQLLKQNISLSHKADRLTLLWEYLTSNYSHLCTKDYLIYALFMQIIRNAPYTADKLFERYNSLYVSSLKREDTDQNREIFDHNQDIFLCVSLNQKNLGHIMFASQNVVQTLGYSIEELKNSTVGTLMPPFFAKKYSKFLQSEVAQHKLSEHLHKEIPAYVRARKGHIQQASLYLTLFPYMDNGLYILARIRLQKPLENYLFMQPNGRIETGTKDIAKRLNLNYNQGSTFIADICLLSQKLFNYIENNFEDDGHEEENIPPTPSSIGGNRMNSQKDLQLPMNSPGLISPHHRISKFSIFHSSHNHTPRNHKLNFRPSSQNYIPENPHSEGITLKFLKMTCPTESFVAQQFLYQVKVATFCFEDQNLYVLKLKDASQDVSVNHGGDLSLRKTARHPLPIKAANTEVEDSCMVPDEAVPMMTTLSPRLPTTNTQIRINLETPREALLSQERLLDSEHEENLSGHNLTKRNLLILQDDDKEDNLRRERRKIAFNIQPISEGGTSSSKLSARESFMLSKVEKAIHQKKTSVSYAVVKIAIVGILLVSIGLFTYYQFHGSASFDHLVSNVGILQRSLDVLFYASEFSRISTPVKLVDLGFIPRNRNGGGQFDKAMLSSIPVISTNLTQANNALRNSMYYFNQEQRDKFYELIEVYTPDDLTTVTSHNAFDIHSQLVSAGLRIYANLPTIPTANNPDLNFILNNTLNSLIIHDTEIFTLLQEEDRQIVNEMADFVLVLLGILVFVGIIVIIVTMKNEARFIKKKMLFFDHFFRFNEIYIRAALYKATDFYEALKDNDLNEEDIMKRVQNLSDSKSRTTSATKAENNNESIQQMMIKKKKANFRWINKDSWVGVLAFIGFISWFWVAYAILYKEFVKHSDSTQTYKSHFIKTGNFLFYMNREIQYLYLYLGGLGDVKVLGQPVEDLLKANQEKVIGVTDYFARLMDVTFNEKYDKLIKTILHGDLCELGLVINKIACLVDGKGATFRGLIGVNSYQYSSLTNLKTKYDSSNKTTAAKIQVYSDSSFAEAERLYYSVMINNYRKLQSIFKELFLIEVDKFKHVIFTLNKVWLVSFFVLAAVYWKFGLKKMEREKVYFRSLLKVIPLSIILESKYLQSYLMKDSNRFGYF